MKSLKYFFAEDENGTLVSIANAIPGKRYYFVGAEPKLQMIIKDGGVRQKHFALLNAEANNKEGIYESYIHAVWKKRIKAKFESGRPLKARYLVGPICSEVNKCEIKKKLPNLQCGNCYLKSVILNEEYDTCELEKGYDGFVGDLRLSDSKHPGKPVLLIEIFYKHECEEEKKKSGIKIIEIKVKDDQEGSIDLSVLNEKKAAIKGFNLKFDKKGNPYDGPNMPDICFYGFDRRAYPIMGLFSVYKVGETLKYKYEKMTITCKMNDDFHSEMSLFEVVIADEFVKEKERARKELLESMCAEAIRNDVKVRNCSLCRNEILSMINRCHCPYMQTHSTNFALVCDKYEVLRRDVERKSKLLKNYPCHIWIKREERWVRLR